MKISKENVFVDDGRIGCRVIWQQEGKRPRMSREKIEKEKLEKGKIEKEKLEKGKIEKEKLEEGKAEKEKAGKKR